ncbi:MAG TPA: sigma factor [Vicinamibacterales bacterium]|jgi:RNA polymerase sigma-70 factor (ECF subfamily)|nr:sigma factor [Vicinamibacterales bacterium]
MPAPRVAPEAKSERAVIAGMRAGDGHTWEMVYKRHYAELVQFGASYVGRSISEELTQDVFATIWQKRETWDPLGGIRAYLFTAVRNRARNALAHGAVARRAATVSGAVVKSSSECAVEVELTLLAGCGDMPEENRLVVGLRSIGMTYAQIAFVVDKTIKSVEHDAVDGVRWLAQRITHRRK